MLLKAGASPNSIDSTGNTPYHFAVSTKNRQIMQLMEDYGGNALIENDKGITPIDYAGLENVKAGKLFFMANQKYRQIMKDNGYIN